MTGKPFRLLARSGLLLVLAPTWFGSVPVRAQGTSCFDQYAKDIEACNKFATGWFDHIACKTGAGLAYLDCLAEHGIITIAG